VRSFVLDGPLRGFDREGIAARRPSLRAADPQTLPAGEQSSLAFYNTFDDIDAMVAAHRPMQGDMGYLAAEEPPCRRVAPGFDRVSWIIELRRSLLRQRNRNPMINA
jgi:hypothetical protein